MRKLFLLCFLIISVAFAQGTADVAELSEGEAQSSQAADNSSFSQFGFDNTTAYIVSELEFQKNLMNPVQELIDTEKAALKVLGKASLKNVGQEMIVSSDLSRQVDTIRIKATADAFAGATFQTIEQAEGEIDELITEISDINTLSEENVQSAFISHIDEHYGDMSTDAAINDMQAQAQEAVTQGAEDIKAWGIQNLETGLVQARAMTAEGKTMFDEWYQNFQTWSNDQIVSHTAHGAELNEKKNEQIADQVSSQEQVGDQGQILLM